MEIPYEAIYIDDDGTMYKIHLKWTPEITGGGSSNLSFIEKSDNDGDDFEETDFDDLDEFLKQYPDAKDVINEEEKLVEDQFWKK